MKKQILIFTLVAFAAILLNASIVKATVWRVNNNPNYTQGCNHCFNNLQLAINDSTVMAGDTIHLEASNSAYLGFGGFQNTILVNKELVILGPGYFLSLNSGLQKNTLSATIERLEFLAGSENSVLKGVRIFETGGTMDLSIKTGNITVESCYIGGDFVLFNPIDAFNIFIRKCYIVGRVMKVNGATNISNLMITNSFIGGTILLDDPSNTYSGEISNCVIIAGGGGDAIDIRSDIQSFHNNIVGGGPGGTPVTLINQNNNGNNIHDNIFINVLPNFPTGPNNILLSAPYVFVPGGSTDSLLNVNPIGLCPECYTGFPSGTETLGIFGGADPYRLSGIPNIPSIYQLQSTLNVIQGAPVNVGFGTRSND